ncbi:MAG: putative Ig domain-containing protein [Pseudomonadota bacterium]
MKKEMFLKMIKGTYENNVLNGTSIDEIMLGLKGHDFLFGEEGDDKMIGHQGNDYFYAGSGDDRAIGNRGDDVMFGEAGNDRLMGSHGDDTASGGEGDDRLFGGQGSDILKGGEGKDVIFGGGGDDFVVHEIGDDGSDKDMYKGAGGFDTIVLVGTEDQFDPDFLDPGLFDGPGKKVDFSKEFGPELNFMAHNFEAVVYNVRPIAADDVFVIIEGTDLLNDNNVLSNDEDPDDTDTLKVVNVTGLSFFEFGGMEREDLDFMRVEFVVEEGTIAKFQIFDPEGDPENFNTLTINMDGTVDFEHFGDMLLFTQGDYLQFTYMIDDGLGGMDEAMANIHINIPPEAEDDTVMQDEDSAQDAPLMIFAEEDLLSNDNDPDDLPDPLFVENIFIEGSDDLITSLGVELTFEMDMDGAITKIFYDATQINFDLLVNLEDLNSLREFEEGDQVEGENFIKDSFEYTLSDGLENDTATVMVMITGENDDPFVENEIEDALVTVGELFMEDLSLVFVDPDFGDELMLSLNDDAPDWLMIDGTMLSGTPDETGEFDVTVIAMDNFGGSAMDEFVITVDPA